MFVIALKEKIPPKYSLTNSINSILRNYVKEYGY